MVWSNWQRAIWRGAAVVVLFWSGLAWTQTTERPGGDPAERIMVVHENGKSTRCRVLESWQLPDGRVAHLLEALDTRERITIVDDQLPGAAGLNPRGMPKRIFSWGSGRTKPPEGSPIPPHLRHDSGVVIQNQTAPPGDVLPTAGGPVIVNRVVDEKPLGASFGTHNDGPKTILEPPAQVQNNPKLIQRLFPKVERHDPSAGP